MLRLATPDDLAAIMAIEKQPDYARFVGSNTLEFHLAAIADADHAYLVTEDENAEVVAFAILYGLSDAMGNIYLWRTAVKYPGQGLGRSFLLEMLAWIFSQPQSHRVWLEHLIPNERAQHVYETIGFKQEGRSREAYLLPDGTRSDLAVMSILRAEWGKRQN
jgi:diamine N-acetyltransferase